MAEELYDELVGLEIGAAYDKATEMIKGTKFTLVIIGPDFPGHVDVDKTRINIQHDIGIVTDVFCD